MCKHTNRSVPKIGFLSAALNVRTRRNEKRTPSIVYEIVQEVGFDFIWYPIAAMVTYYKRKDGIHRVQLQE